MLLGEQAVGKSSLLARYCDNEFSINMIGTVGIDFRKKIVLFGNQEIKLTIFDTAGQQRFKLITKNFLKGTQGVAIIYDSSDRMTLERMKEWIESVLKDSDLGIQIVIVSNKIDLERQVPFEEAEKIAKDYGLPLVESSAKTGQGVDDVFLTIIKKVLNYKEDEKRKEQEQLANLDNGNKNIVIENSKSEIKHKSEVKKKNSKCCSG
jgi:small GTP-binding protein